MHDVNLAIGLLAVQIVASSLIAAMAAGDPAPCPVLEAWSKSAVIMGQMTKAKKMLLLQYPTLGRATLVDNADVLAPLLNHMGHLPQKRHKLLNASLYPAGNRPYRVGLRVYIV